MGSLRRNRVTLAATLVVAAVAATVSGFVLTAHGYPTRHVELNDGGIWVTSDKDGLYGRLNKPAGALDLALNPPGGAQQAYQIDVRQDGAAVLSWDQASGKLYPVDVAAGSARQDQAIAVSSREQVQLGGGTLAVLDPTTRRVWATHVDVTRGILSLAALSSQARPVAVLGTSAVPSSAPQAASLAVGVDGTVYAVTASGRVAVSKPTATGFVTKYSQLDQSLQSVQVTAVGNRMVVFDAKAGTVLLPGGLQTQVSGSAASVIQQPSASTPSVVLATPSQLLAIPLNGGNAVPLYRGVRGTPAAPTWLGGCVYAAWGGADGGYARSCDGAPAQRGVLANRQQLNDPVFRVNRGSILLNDLTTGAVFDLDTMQRVDDWLAIKPPPVQRRSNKRKNNNPSVAARNLPPKAVDVTLGARPGRTTVLHILDADSDPQGYVLAISSVGAPDDSTASLSIAPDAQTVEITMPPKGGDVHFRYTIDNGKGLSASATVTVQRRSPGENELPALRHGFAQPTYSVGAGGSLTMPVLGDWRDFDGDPIVLRSATASAGMVTTTPEGNLDYVAPAGGGHQSITYQVSDGVGVPVSHTVPITVLPSNGKAVEPVAEPDTARGETGKPITITPLANDLPGVDPTNPNARLALAGDVASPADTTVATNLKTGTITVTASHAGTYSLSYTDAFGTAPFARGTIRVDVKNPPPSPLPPITVPVTAALHGQAPATVDVLAADYDPAGGVLTVQHAAPVSTDGQLQVAIVAGRWLRITALRPQIAPTTQLVNYMVTDGVSSPVTGQVTVTQLPAPAYDTPLAITDYATVRAGDSASIPVLANDVDPDGAQLSLLDDVPGAPHPGQLSVAAANDSAVGAGSAYVSGTQVRYVAPATVTAPEVVQLSYVARNPSGNEATGTVMVTVVPPPTPSNPDQAPAPQDVTARLVAGDTVSIPIQTSGIDPDGDSATVIGIGSAPHLGRVLAVGATSITYQAFPTSAGSDTFTYLVTDRYGLTGTATINVGVAQPGQPQPPVAVDESITAAPNSHVRVDVLSNAIIAPDDLVTITPLDRTNPDLPAGISLASPTGPIEVDTSAAGGHPIVVAYSLSDGIGTPSVATITVHVQTGFVQPPIALDAVATPRPNATSVEVNVLDRDSDPAGSPLSISRVFDPAARVTGGSVIVPVLAHVQNIPYEIEDANGARAAAVIHVPATGSGAPYAIPNRLISVGKNGSTTVDIAQYVADPAGRHVRLTTTNELSAAPASGLRVASRSSTSLTLTGISDYVGPAAVTFQVTDGASLNDPRGQLAIITVPVQVGPDTPVLRCPSDPIQLVEGGAPQTVDVGTFCHVWTSDPGQQARLNFTASWHKQPSGVSVTGAGSHQLTLTAGGSARPGDTGVLSVGVSGSGAVHSELNVTILPLGPPSISPIAIDGFKAGNTATRNVTGYVTSPLRDPHITVVRIHQLSGMPATTSSQGAAIQITPGSASHGQMTFAIVVSDVADPNRVDRQTDGTVTMNVLKVPDAPGTPVPGRTVLSRVVQLAWTTPAANGAPIDSYQVSWSGGSTTCPASPCTVGGLTNGNTYRFTVRAHNSVGYGPRSGVSAAATPDALPGAPQHLTVSDPQNGSVLLTWSPAPNIGSAIQNYTVSWSGGHSTQVPGTSTSVRATGLINDNVYTFTVVAVNRKGTGPPTSATGQSAGNPPAPTGLQVQYANGAGTTQRVVTVSWQATDPNGAGPTTYTVTRNGAAICAKTQATSCTDTPSSGATYTYSVVAANAAGHSSPATSTQFAVAGTPDTITNLSAQHTGVDGQLRVSYTVPNSNGARSTIQCSYNGGSCPSWTPTGAPGSAATQDISNLPNDAQITVTLTDCNEQQCGAPNSTNSALTDGPPGGPGGISCSLNGQTVTWSWSRPAPINGYAVHFQLSGATSGTTNNTSWSHSYQADGNSHTLTVTSVDSRGEAGGSSSQTCQDKAPPPPPAKSVAVTMGSFAPSLPGCASGCHYVVVTLKNFTPNTTYRVQAQAGHPYNSGSGILVMHTDGNGNYSGSPGPYYGYPDWVSATVGGVTGTCSGDWGSPSGHC